MYDYIVHFIYTRNVNILGWPSWRRKAVWWSYEFHNREKWLAVADKTKAFHDAVERYRQMVEERDEREQDSATS